MKQPKSELIEKYANLIVDEMVVFVSDFTSFTLQELDIEPSRDLPVFKVEMKKYLSKLLNEFENNG
jgi:hypothetical protein